MSIRDARKLNLQDQYRLRKRIVRLRKRGKRNTEIAEDLCISQSQASKVWKRYCDGGEDALKHAKRGRQHGSGRKLNYDQERKIVELIVGHTPNNLELPYRFWNREAIKLQIKKHFEIDVPLRTISDFLKRWEFKAEKTLIPSDFSEDEWVKQWFDVDFPRIREQAKKDRTEIHWGSRVKLKNVLYCLKNDNIGPNNRYYMFSSITDQKHIRFIIYEGFLSEKMFIDFISRLIIDTKKNIYLMMPKHLYRNTANIESIFERNKHKIKIFDFPTFTHRSFK